MKFEIWDEIHMDQEDREKMYNSIIENGFDLETEKDFDTNGDEFKIRFITINSLEDLIKLKDIVDYYSILVHKDGLAIVNK